MERDIFAELEKWKDSEDRKPLLLSGVRGCGKTYILEEFGRRCFPDTARFDFEEDPGLSDIFERDLNPVRILKELSGIRGSEIGEDTLLILDEIQFCERAVTSLKYFCEEIPQYNVIGAGSLLYVRLSTWDESRVSRFPVGTVNLLTMHPMSFREFLEAGGDEGLAEYAEDYGGLPLPDGILTELDDLYREYLFVGGMPEAVKAWMTGGSMEDVDLIQNGIVESYRRDFAQYAPAKIASDVAAVWDSVPKQLATDSRGFHYSRVRPCNGGKEMRYAIDWLEKVGLIHRVTRIIDTELPLRANEDRKVFQLYLCDTGLMRAMLGLPPEEVLVPKDSSDRAVNALERNYVLDGLKRDGFEHVFYWTELHKTRMDFVVQIGLEAVPIAVRSGDRVHELGLTQYTDRFSPRKMFLMSGKNLRNGAVTYLPLSLAWMFKGLARMERCVPEGVSADLFHSVRWSCESANVLCVNAVTVAKCRKTRKVTV